MNNTYDFKKLALMGIIGGMMFASYAHAIPMIDAGAEGPDLNQMEKNGCKGSSSCSGKNSCKGTDVDKGANSCAGAGGCAGKKGASEG